MKFSILSGKGGTGKTLCAVNLAAVSPGSIYIDCDIEEPDGHLFFKPKINKAEKVTVFFPNIDPALCNRCRQCVDFCRFNALAMVSSSITVFPDVCHSCGGCAVICPMQAISVDNREIGISEDGIAGNNSIITGLMHPGHESGVPIIRKMQQMVANLADLIFIDCPPGTSCSTVESINEADFCVFVTEPTNFGAHDLEMVYALVKSLNKPSAAILNKTGSEDDPSELFCIKNGIPIVGKIPYDPQLGKINSEALVAVWENEEYRNRFFEILTHLIKEANDEAITPLKR